MATTDFRYFPLIFKNIVEAARVEYSGTELIPAGTTPYFEFGTYLELTKQVAIKDQIDSPKYPLVWLVWEANENVQNWINEDQYNVGARIFICNHTSSDYTSEERYTANFVGVLFPIFELLKKYIADNHFTSNANINQYQLAEHLLWGESLGFEKNQNVIFDTLDAVEIKYNSLGINRNKC